MTSKSLWMTIAVALQATPLRGDERCDVAVIGSGIAGLSTAYELSQRGRSVIVIDRGPIAGGMTARTSAHLAPSCDDLMSEMQKIRVKTSRNFSMKARPQRLIASKKFRRTKGSIATSGVSTAIYFRATVCRLT